MTGAPGDPSRPRFHVALPVDDLDAARAFYGGVLGCPEGRSDEDWVDWDLRGHQVVTHRVDVPADTVPSDGGRDSGGNREFGGGRDTGRNPVDGHQVPVPHFGLILQVDEFHELSARLRDSAAGFVIEPYVRFEGQPGEQWTMFLRDPAGNALEFKAFADDGQVFARD